MRKMLLIFTLIILAVPVLAQEKATTDPNTSAAAVAKADTDEDIQTDSRLLQKITLSESRKTVSVILADLTKSTGITFKAGYNNNDWQVRDRKMCIFAKDVPLVQIMNSIAHVMKFKWIRKGEPGNWTYRLFMDRRTLLDADSQRLREDERLREKATQKRQEALENYTNIDNFSPEEMAALKSKDPLTYVFATTGIAGSLGQMFREVPAMSEAVAGGQPITMTGADMSEQGRAGISRLMTSLWNLGKLLKQAKGDIGTIDPANVTFMLNQDLERQGGGMPQSIVLATVTIRFSEGGQANFPLMNPESAIGQAIGNLLIKVTEGQIQPKDNMNDMINAEVQKATPKDIQNISKDYGEPENQHPDDPAFKVKLKLTPDGNRLADIQKALAEASSYAVVSDSFGKLEYSSRFGSIKDENELGAVLDKISKETLYNWDKRASVLEFRDREWFRKRSAQIPEATIEGWRQAFVNTGTLDIDDLAEISRLDGGQLDQNVGEDEILGSMEIRSLMWMYRDILRFYASLTNAQRSAALSDMGLDFRALSPEQFGVAYDMLKIHNAKFLNNPDAQLILKITSEKKDKQIHYKYTTTTTDDLPPIKGEFTTPKYEEPKKPEKTQDKPKHADPAKPEQKAK